MNRDNRGGIQSAIDFLVSLDGSDASSLATAVDLCPLLTLAQEQGVITDAASLQDAFAMIMRARLLTS